jgi:dienelactone hydrolase
MSKTRDELRPPPPRSPSTLRVRRITVVLLTVLASAPAVPARAETNNLRLSLDTQNNNVRLRWPTAPTERFQVEHRPGLESLATWQPLVTNLPAGSGAETAFIHSNALNASAGFYRVLRWPAFTFDWSGTNFTYTDAERTFTGILLKPPGNGPFPAVIISHGAGGTATGYSLNKAREMSAWSMVCIGPTLTHAAGGETNPVNMGNCPENLSRATACANVLASLPYVDTNRIALFGHSMGAFATIGDAAALVGRIRAAAITAGGVISDSPNASSNAAPTVTEASPVRTPFILFHCDADPVVPPVRSLLFQQVLNSNAVLNLRILYSSNSIPNTNNWHNIHQDAAVNADVLTNTFQWFKARGVLP